MTRMEGRAYDHYAPQHACLLCSCWTQSQLRQNLRKHMCAAFKEGGDADFTRLLNQRRWMCSGGIGLHIHVDEVAEWGEGKEVTASPSLAFAVVEDLNAIRTLQLRTYTGEQLVWAVFALSGGWAVLMHTFIDSEASTSTPQHLRRLSSAGGDLLRRQRGNADIHGSAPFSQDPISATLDEELNAVVPVEQLQLDKLISTLVCAGFPSTSIYIIETIHSHDQAWGRSRRHAHPVSITSTRLATFCELTACGGFSYGDVLHAGKRWAHSVLLHGTAYIEPLQALQAPKGHLRGVVALGDG
ncbi:hypothetical protein FIBSPDRAFT_949389 [Athelia psychrophila]|uniref:Uncharacterized protein n=1 Tax=Athelia psychrophila TaxID=1759441 RepID=A0A166PWI4_9AGAM|nr:hypothetical protein FIBSPDRAFT_949389 [Fibularhizoctonia sp. CBS 109695]